jgi:hypothetical protein
MQVINRQKDALPASLDLDGFGKAMAQLDLSTVPPEKKAAAIRDHLMRIMVDTLHDRDKAMEIANARLFYAKF